MMTMQISPVTTALIRKIYAQLDYKTLGNIYCYEGGDEFWRAKRKPCERLGINLSQALLNKLPRGGRSLYVGAGVAELPAESSPSFRSPELPDAGWVSSACLEFIDTGF